MSIYLDKYKIFLELNRTVNGKKEKIDEEKDEEDDEHEVDDTEANDYTATENDEDFEDPEDNNEEEGNEDDNTEDNSEDDEHEVDDTEANDYTADNGEDDTEEGNDEDDVEDEEDTEGDDSETSDEVKDMENELFKSIPADQMVIKVTELKKHYLDVYNSISNILLRTNKIIKTNENIKVLEFVTNKLIELKDMVKFYMAHTFDTKSFIENTINYQQYLATLNTINKIFKEIHVKKDDK